MTARVSFYKRASRIDTTFATPPNCISALGTVIEHLLQNGYSWPDIRDNMPSLCQQKNVTNSSQQIIDFIKETPINGCGYYRRDLLFSHQYNTSPFTIVGFVFSGALHLHVYASVNNPTKTVYGDIPLASLIDSVKTQVHDHHCSCLSYTVSKPENTIVLEHLYTVSENGTLTRVETRPRTPMKAELDTHDGGATAPYIHAIESCQDRPHL